MLRITLENNTQLSQEDLVDVLRRHVGGTRIGNRKPIGDIRISPRSASNDIVLTLGRGKGIEKDIFLRGTIDTVRKAHMAFEDVVIKDPDIPEMDDDDPVDNDENTVYDSHGDPVTTLV